MLGVFQSNRYDIIVTTSHGHHLQLRLNFSPDWTFRNYMITGVYRKYGSLTTMNWASSVSMPEDPYHPKSLVLCYSDKRSGSMILTLQKVAFALQSNNLNLPYN